MGEFVNRCYLDVNGQSIEDFKAVTEREREYFRQIKLMNKIGHVEVLPNLGASVDYVVPETEAEFEWEAVADGRLTIEYLNGKRITYTGVYVLKVGEAKIDGESELVKTIELGAEKRLVE